MLPNGGRSLQRADGGGQFDDRRSDLQGLRQGLTLAVSQFSHKAKLTAKSMILLQVNIHIQEVKVKLFA